MLWFYGAILVIFVILWIFKKMKELTDFQKKFFARGTGATLFTQEEFDQALAVARAEIMQIAIDTTKTAIAIEREECAKIADGIAQRMEDGGEGPTGYIGYVTECAEAIRNRLKK
jgi:hypothetical protein